MEKRRERKSETRRIRRERRNRSVRNVVLTLLILAVVGLAAQASDHGPGFDPHAADRNYTCVPYQVDGGLLLVEPGRPVVRSYPWLSENTSLGRISDRENDGVVLKIDSVLRCDEDSTNGPYYGIAIADLSEEELRHFPKEVLEAPTDTVWVSGKYLYTSSLSKIID